MTPWKESKRWADQFIPHIRWILANYFIVEATPMQDAQENTDLVFELAGGGRLGTRIRNFAARNEHPSRRNEWTIRFSRPSGTRTEFRKILRGLGDYYFYGWGDDTGHKPLVRAYTILDIHAVQDWLADYGYDHEGKPPGMLQDNDDRSSKFLGIPLGIMPPETIIARKTWIDGDPLDEQSNNIVYGIHRQKYKVIPI